jgi:predicted lactoylglutathione lyase
MLLVNIPVADLERSRAFFAKLGFSLGSAIGSFANSANFSRLSSMTNACSPTSMQAAVSSVNIGL